MKVVVISQARMTSTRLPGKVLKEVLGKPLLEYQIERLRRVASADEVVVATTTNDTDDPIVELCEKLDCPYYRGSEEDVLSRYYYAAVEHQADLVVRVTSDCPIIDPRVVDQVIGVFLTGQGKYDYVSNTLVRTYPRGMDTEVFSVASLSDAFSEGRLGHEREHVTSFFYTRPERYHLANVFYHEDCSRHRWTVDTREDFILIEKILCELAPVSPLFTLEEILELMKLHPDWVQINAHVEQKKLGQ